MNNAPTTEDRIWAVLSHLSALTFGIGIVLPIIGWADQRRKSNYASFQCLQALGYQSLGFTVWILSYLVGIILISIILLALIGSTRTDNQNPDTILGRWVMIIFIFVVVSFAIYFVLPIIAAVACGFGMDFRYPVMGDRLARYLDYDPTQELDGPVWLNEDHEFRWVAGMGHFSILIMLWGMLAPLTAWILYGKRSVFLKFQSIQTFIFQAGVTILFVGAGILYLFGFLSLIAITGSTGEPNPTLSMGGFGVIVLGLSLLISFMILLFIPLLHILGQWAGYRVLKGDNYRYPIVGKLVDRLISRREKSGLKENLA